MKVVLHCRMTIFFAVFFSLLMDLFGWSAGGGAYDPKISISGKDFYKDNNRWQAKGVVVEGFNAPAHRPNAWLVGRGYWGEKELDVVKTLIGGDTVRIQVSQPGLDPQSTIYDPAYLQELINAVRLAQRHGFAIVLSMDAQAENGLQNLSCMPGISTLRAWQTLAPSFAGDQGVMFELFNEPCKQSSPTNVVEWARSMQALVDGLRLLSARNILLLDGLWWARSTNGLFPLVHDTLPGRLALAVHPYFVSRDVFASPSQWRDQFGASATRYPLIATEWNATESNGCVGPSTPTLALELVRYLQTLRVGLIGWAIDANYGKLIVDHDRYELTDYTGFTTCGKQPGRFGAGRLLAAYPND